MDSGNSGSMQSSSTAGDEEYDSRADSSSISVFLNNNNNVNHVPPPPQPTTTTTTTLTHHVGPFTHNVFDPLSNYLDPTQRITPNQILNLDMVWSKVAAAAAATRSEPPDLAAGLIPCSSSSPHNNNQAFLLSQLGTGQSQTQTQTQAQIGVNATTFSTTLQNLSESDRNCGSNSTNTNANAVRNPKKRSRASRRAPTTVLTTDTTNFRAMVQEFTGIPAPPFNSSPFPRTRLDLFASSSSPPIMRSTSTHLDPSTTAPSYLPRPFSQKVKSQPSIPPMLDTLASHSSSTNNNFHNPLNLHNPILTLQSMLQSPPKYNNPCLLLASKTQQQQQQPQPSLEIRHSGVDSSHIRMGGLEELGLSHAHVGGHHQNMVQTSSDLALSRVNNSNNYNNLNNSMNGPSSANWAQAQAQAQAQRIGINDGGVLRSLSGGTLNYRSNVPDQRVSNGPKVNFSGGGASDFHGDKGPECAVVARSEGMVESWINCSSD